MGKVVTTVDKAKFIGVEIFKEAVGTVGGFGGVWLGEKLGLSQEQSMLLGMTTSIVSSKGADWVDNNLDNLTLATKYTFNNSGKNVTLGCNGGDLYGFGKDYYNNFKKFKNGEIIFNSIDDVINSGINSVDDLMKLGVNSVDDLAKLKVSSIDDLAKIGIKNKNDLAKLGIDSSDLKKLGIDPKVFEITADSIKKVKYGEQFTKANRKKTLKANITYTDINNYSYQTDSYGRIVKATTSDLKLGEGKRNPYAQRTVGGEDRLPTDDEGHLFGTQFNGSGEIDNLLPQDAKINRSGGEWYLMESEWRDALNDGYVVKVNIIPKYKNKSLRLISYTVKYEIDGVKYIKNIKNA